MRLFKRFILSVLVLSCSYLVATPDDFYHALVDESEEELVQYFRELQSMSTTEARELLELVCDYVESQSEVAYDRSAIYNQYMTWIYRFDKSHEFVFGAKCRGEPGVGIVKDEDESSWEVNADMVIGGVEVFAGALLAILPSPWTKRAAFTLASDGGTRFFDGLGSIRELSEEERRHPQSGGLIGIQF